MKGKDKKGGVLKTNHKIIGKKAIYIDLRMYRNEKVFRQSFFGSKNARSGLNQPNRMCAGLWWQLDVIGLFLERRTKLPLISTENNGRKINN